MAPGGDTPGDLSTEGRAVDNRAVTRRGFLRLGAATAVAAGAVATLGSGTAFAQTDGGDAVQTLQLDPTGGGSSCRHGHGNGTCAACNACKGHAKNKVFRTSDAADANRAHTGCRCAVVKGQTLPTPIADAVFGKSDVVDRRDPKVADLLDNGTVGGVEVPVFAAGAPILLAVGGGVGYWLWRRKHRDPVTADVDQGEWK